MKVGVRLFLSSTAFGIVMATIYWYTTREVIGTMLLGMMSLALLLVATYIRIAEREAHLRADDRAGVPEPGERMGRFTLESYWPFFGALTGVLLFVSVVFFSGAALALQAIAAGGLLLALRFLILESS
jgi:membrane protein CcdC involved in cytochrome C biogenesis